MVGVGMVMLNNTSKLGVYASQQQDGLPTKPKVPRHNNLPRPSAVGHSPLGRAQVDGESDPRLLLLA